MYAAIAAAREGASVLLLDKSQIGRGGATIMAQMTVAVALGEQEADSVQLHFQDTLNAGRGLCNQALAYLLCEDGPKRIREMAQWGTRWAREDGHIKQEMAPGHSVKRCCYVDFLNTGPAVAATLRRKVSETAAIRRISNLAVVEILVSQGRAMGAVALNLADGQWLVIEAKAVILAAGGLTKLYQRNSASANMGGEAYAMALWAGAELIDMEFVQFFPIGHLAPRLVGMDPIMWDPFRYKLGGKLLNGKFEEFIDRYGSTDFGKYNATRDVAAYAILKEVEAGRGTPHGGAYLDFRHVAEADLRAAFGPVIDRLLTNGIDLTKTAVEVGPMAHYHMGGIRVGADMQTRIAGLYAAGEAWAAPTAPIACPATPSPKPLFSASAPDRARRVILNRPVLIGMKPRQRRRSNVCAVQLAAMAPAQRHRSRCRSSCKNSCGRTPGRFAGGEKLSVALARIERMRQQLPSLNLAAAQPYNMDLQDWFELRAMLTTAAGDRYPALVRTESRGAHQREDFPAPDDSFLKNQALALDNGELRTSWIAPVRLPGG